MAPKLSLAQADWTYPHLQVLKGCIALSYDIAADGMDRIPANVRSNPNVAYTQGNVRWLTLDTLLFEACAAGELPGMVATWHPNKSGPSSLEISSSNSIVYTAHLQSPASPPAASEIKLGTMDYNQEVFEFIKSDSSTSAVHLLLVHCGKEFAALRAYYDRDNRGRYYQIGGNIMAGAKPSNAFETEPIRLVEPKLLLPPTPGEFSARTKGNQAGAS
jgi:hypothetical protein